MTVGRRIERLIELALVAVERCRARLLALRGASVGEKVRVGARVRVDRPWALRLGPRTVLEHDVWLKIVADDARLEIGDHVFIGRGVEFDVQASVRVGAHALIAPGAFITDHEHRVERARRIDEQGCAAVPVSIGSDAWVGAHAVVLAGVSIGDGAVIGAGAVVRHDVPAYTIAAGVPARPIGARQ